jgi:aryl-alcohol dehydrogenase-like predicted oxidoreductase
VEDSVTIAALDSCAAAVVASATLAAGALTGRGRTGRAARLPDTPRWARAFAVGGRLSLLAAELGATAAQLALAFVLANFRVATVLFGASAPEQVRENVGALDLLGRLGDSELAELRSLGT